MSRAWFKFYGRDFRDGVRDLPFDVVGVYTVLLTLMYEEHGGRIKDHDQRMCRLIGCDIRVWRRAKSVLIEAGKLRLSDDGFLTNDRAEAETNSAELLSEIRRTSARSSGEIRRKSERSSPQISDSNTAKSRKTKDPPPANAADLPLYACAVPESEPDIDTPSLRSGVSAATPKKRQASKQQISIDQPFTDKARAYAADRGFLNGSAEALWERFTAHHAAKGTLFANPDAGWQTWVLNEIKFNGGRNDGFGSTGNHGARAGAAARAQPRSAASLIMERAFGDELDEDPGTPMLGRIAGPTRSD